MSSLEHHGIKGQKWGVRRFQNPDGTRTSEGRNRDKQKRFNNATVDVLAKVSTNVKPIQKEPANIHGVIDRAKCSEDDARTCIKLADEIYARAASEEPRITKDITGIVNKTGFSMYGLDHRLKQPTSIAGKIGSDAKSDGVSYEEASKGIKDAVRYTTVSDNESFVSDYRTLKQGLESKGYEEVKCKNFFEKYRAGEVQHKAVQTTFKSPTGYEFELQFQTPESQAAKELKIPIYEERRKQGIGSSRAKELEKQMRDLAEQVPYPDGIETIESHNKLKHSSIGGNMYYIYGNTLVLSDSSSYLEHHGIKGQRWGVRRFQNKDGSLTNAGRKRLGYSTKDVKTALVKGGKAVGGAAVTIGKVGYNLGKKAAAAGKAHSEKKKAEKLEKKKEKASKTRLGVVKNADLFTAAEMAELNKRFKAKDEMTLASLQKGADYFRLAAGMVGSVASINKDFESMTGKSLIPNPVKKEKEKREADERAEDRARKLAKEDAEEDRKRRADERKSRADDIDFKNKSEDLKNKKSEELRKQAAEARAQAKQTWDEAQAAEKTRAMKGVADENEAKAAIKRQELKTNEIAQREEAVAKREAAAEESEERINYARKEVLKRIDDADTYRDALRKATDMLRNAHDLTREQQDEVWAFIKKAQEDKLGHDGMDGLYLEHHGILGQKWGIRRFQNKDGSRTAEGKKRYKTMQAAHGTRARGNSPFDRAKNQAIDKAKGEFNKLLDDTRYGKNKAKYDAAVDEWDKAQTHRYDEYEREFDKYASIAGMANAYRWGWDQPNTGFGSRDNMLKFAADFYKYDDGDQGKFNSYDYFLVGKGENPNDVQDRAFKASSAIWDLAKEDAKDLFGDLADKKDGPGSTVATSFASSMFDYATIASPITMADESSGLRYTDKEIKQMQEDIRKFSAEAKRLGTINHSGAFVEDGTLYLEHHGIKGQRWGVRRFQNPDGTLTDKGRKHYQKKLDLEDRKLTAAKAAQGRYERVRTPMSVGMAVIGAIAGGLAGSPAGPAGIAAGAAFVSAISGGSTYAEYTVKGMFAGHGANRSKQKIAKYKDMLKQDAFIVEDGTLYLEHFGIKNMKWGVRRFQNKDGSLTEAGKKRYGSGNDGEELSGGVGGGGAPEEDEEMKKKIEEAAKKAGMTVAEYRKKFANVITNMKQAAKSTKQTAKTENVMTRASVAAKAAGQVASDVASGKSRHKSAKKVYGDYKNRADVATMQALGKIRSDDEKTMKDGMYKNRQWRARADYAEKRGDKKTAEKYRKMSDDELNRSDYADKEKDIVDKMGDAVYKSYMLRNKKHADNARSARTEQWRNRVAGDRAERQMNTSGAKIKAKLKSRQLPVAEAGQYASAARDRVKAEVGRKLATRKYNKSVNAMGEALASGAKDYINTPKVKKKLTKDQIAANRPVSREKNVKAGKGQVQVGEKHESYAVVNQRRDRRKPMTTHDITLLADHSNEPRTHVLPKMKSLKATAKPMRKLTSKELSKIRSEARVKQLKKDGDYTGEYKKKRRK